MSEGVVVIQRVNRVLVASPGPQGAGISAVDPSPAGTYTLATVTVDVYGRVISASAGTGASATAGIDGGRW